MILIGESINIVSKRIGEAIKNRDKKPIQELAITQAEAGADYLDLNIGPARKAGDELMEWIVKVVQEVVDLPLFLDTRNVDAIKVGLKLAKRKPVINSISYTPDRMEALLPLVKEYNCDFVALLWGKEGMPRDASERGIFASEFIAKVIEMGIPPEAAFVDPIVTPVSSQQDQVKALLEFMEMFQEMELGARTTCGLSNVSNSSPPQLRGLINRTYLIMLMKYGLSSAIVDVLDKELVEIARGKRQNLVNLVHRVMAGEKIDMSKLSKEEIDYVKTAKVLNNESLYSHSWLEL